MSPSLSAKRKLFGALTVICDQLPLIILIFSLIFCSVPVFRLGNDGTVRETQSVFGLASKAGEISASVMKADYAQKTDIALARSLRFIPAAVCAVFVICGIFSLLLSAVSLFCSASDPLSGRVNRVKNAFRVFFPGRWLQAVIGVLPLLPLCVPYYVIDRFAEFYRVSGNPVNDSGAYVPQYYQYSVSVSGINPLIVAGLLSALEIILIFALAGKRRALRADVFELYTETP